MTDAALILHAKQPIKDNTDHQNRSQPATSKPGDIILCWQLHANDSLQCQALHLCENQRINGNSSSTLIGDNEKTPHTSNCSDLQFNSELTQRYLMKRRICTWDLLTHLIFEPVFTVIFRRRTAILLLPPSLDTL